MKIHKEIVWNKGENPKKDGEYLFIQLWDDGSVTYAAKLGYTVLHGWNRNAAALHRMAAHCYARRFTQGKFRALQPHIS